LASGRGARHAFSLLGFGPQAFSRGQQMSQRIDWIAEDSK